MKRRTLLAVSLVLFVALASAWPAAAAAECSADGGQAGEAKLLFTGAPTWSLDGDDPQDPDTGEPPDCHPVAAWLAGLVTSLFGEGKASQEYLCEDIYAIFEAPLETARIGFGRMIHAFNLVKDGLELSWEDTLSWRLEGGGGWGQLTQLQSLADELPDKTLAELMALVDGGTSLSDIRTAARLADKYGAAFDDVLGYLENGSPGGVMQLLDLAEEMGITPEELAAYLGEDLSLAKIRQAWRLADGDLTVLEEILASGIQQYRKDQRDQKHAQRIADKYGADVGDVLNLFHGACSGNWGCVRAEYR